MNISKDRIVEASIIILNRDGIEYLTMRNIAKELGIKASSIYWHVSGKWELYSEITEYLCAQYPLPKNDDAKLFLEELYKIYRTMLLSTRDAVPVFENSIPNTPKRMEIIKVTMEALSKMGIADQNLLTISNLLNNYVLSFVADELRFKQTPTEVFDDFSGMLGDLGRRVLINTNYDDQFLYGLRVIFAGLETLEVKHLAD